MISMSRFAVIFIQSAAPFVKPAQRSVRRGKRGEEKVQRERETVKKTPRDGCTEKPQSGSCDSGIARLRGKCSGLALQRAV